MAHMELQSTAMAHTSMFFSTNGFACCQPGYPIYAPVLGRCQGPKTSHTVSLLSVQASREIAANGKMTDA